MHSIILCKKVFLHLTVHTVHPDNFPFNIIEIRGDELVKSEQSTLHPCADLRIEAKECRIRMWSEGGGKKFFFGFIVHTVHPSILPFIFSNLSGEQKVKGEQCTVHHRGCETKKTGGCRSGEVMSLRARRTSAASRCYCLPGG